MERVMKIDKNQIQMTDKVALANFILNTTTETTNTPETLGDYTRNNTRRTNIQDQPAQQSKRLAKDNNNRNRQKNCFNNRQHWMES
jgi:hypothetical protein